MASEAWPIQSLVQTTMAPIPSGFDNETNTLILDLQRRQKDLSDFQLGRLRECRESVAVQQRFANEMKEDLDFFERQTEVRIPLRMLYVTCCFM